MRLLDELAGLTGLPDTQITTRFPTSSFVAACRRNGERNPVLDPSTGEFNHPLPNTDPTQHDGAMS